MTEEHPFNNRTMYGATKIAGEQFLRAFHEQYGLDYVALRYMNAYGPRMDDKGVYVSVIAKTLDKLDRGERPVIFGDGSQAYDFVYVTDLARSNVLALAADVTDAAYNVGTGVQTTIRELVEELIAITGVDVEPEYRAEGVSHVTNRVGGTEAAERDLGFVARDAVARGPARARRVARSRARTVIPISRPYFGEEERREIEARARVRLGRPGAAGAGVRAPLRRLLRRRARGRGDLVHDRAAPRASPRSAPGRATRSWCPPSPGSRPPTRSRTPARRRCSATCRSTPSTSIPARWRRR